MQYFVVVLSGGVALGVSSVASSLCTGCVASGMTSMSCTSQKSKHSSLDTVVSPYLLRLEIAEEEVVEIHEG